MRASESDWFLRGALDAAADGVLVECRETVRYINNAYARVLGYRGALDLHGATIHEIAEPDDEKRLRWFGERRLKGLPAPNRYMFRARRRDESIVWLDASISTTRLGDEFFITTIVREVRNFDRAALPNIAGLNQLSPREYQILMYTLRGFRPKEIALHLDISDKTVATHRSRIFHKLSLRGLEDLFRFAAEHDLLESRPVHRIVSPDAPFTAENDSGSESSVASATIQRSAGDSEVVLVVDGDATIRREVAMVLRRAGFAVETASGGAQAVKRLTTKQYAAVVLDLAIPDIGEHEVVEQLAETIRDKKCVVLTSAGTKARLNNLPEKLIHLEIRKPFDVDDIVQAVKGCIGADTGTPPFKNSPRA